MVLVAVLLLIIYGLLCIYRPSLEWMIKTSNTMRGVETKITSGTVICYRIIGTIFLIVGLLILLGSLSSP